MKRLCTVGLGQLYLDDAGGSCSLKNKNCRLVVVGKVEFVAFELFSLLSLRNIRGASDVVNGKLLVATHLKILSAGGF